MPDFFVTFGGREIHGDHPTFPPAHPNGWVRVVGATSWETAKVAADEAFGLRYFMVRAADDLLVNFYPLSELAELDVRTAQITLTDQEEVTDATT